MTLPTYDNVILHEYREGAFAEITLPVSAEYAMLLKINGSPYITIACSGNHLREHITGYLLTEGIISAACQIERMEIDESAMIVNTVLMHDESIEEQLKKIQKISAAGGRTKKHLPPNNRIRKNTPEISAKVIIQAINEFLNYSHEHEMTHGVHSAALYSLKGERLAFYDEIGRHNAIDKIIGHAALENISLEDKIICSTGRISSEIAFKIINACAPVLVTRASPTTMSIKILRQYNILSIIRAGNGKFIVINGREKIKP